MCICERGLVFAPFPLCMSRFGGCAAVILVARSPHPASRALEPPHPTTASPRRFVPRQAGEEAEEDEELRDLENRDPKVLGKFDLVRGLVVVLAPLGWLCTLLGVTSPFMASEVSSLYLMCFSS